MMEEKAREGKVCVSPQLRGEGRGKVMQKEDVDMLLALNIDLLGIKRSKWQGERFRLRCSIFQPPFRDEYWSIHATVLGGRNRF